VSAPSRQGNKTHIATCVQCGCLSGLQWAGWGAYRVDDPNENELPALAFFCPRCAAREFGRRAD
jgi:hypothetical protein